MSTSKPQLVLDNTPFIVSEETERACVDFTLAQLVDIGAMKVLLKECSPETVANVLAIAITVRARQGLPLT